MNSTDEDMERMLLRYFINDDWAARGFQPLDSIFEQTHRPSGWRNSFFDQLQTPEEKGALSAILERMVGDGLLDSKKADNGQEVYYRASDYALKTERYQKIYPTFDQVDKKSEALSSIHDAVVAQTMTEPKLTYHPPVLDSSSWTGLPKDGVLDESSVNRLKIALSNVDRAVGKSGATNEEKAQARAYVLAIHALADAPEPPADLIWEMVSRANQFAGIASFFVSLIALFATVAN